MCFIDYTFKAGFVIFLTFKSTYIRIFETYSNKIQLKIPADSEEEDPNRSSLIDSPDEEEDPLRSSLIDSPDEEEDPLRSSLIDSPDRADP